MSDSSSPETLTSVPLASLSQGNPSDPKKVPQPKSSPGDCAPATAAFFVIIGLLLLFAVFMVISCVAFFLGGPGPGFFAAVIAASLCISLLLLMVLAAVCMCLLNCMIGQRAVSCRPNWFCCPTGTPAAAPDCLHPFASKLDQLLQRLEKCIQDEIADGEQNLVRLESAHDSVQDTDRDRIGAGLTEWRNRLEALKSVEGYLKSAAGILIAWRSTR